MAPGLRPGDVVTTGWLPLRDRRAAPGRFECWVLWTNGADAPGDDVPILKRVVGLPGEEVALVDGDVTVAGRTIVKSPDELAGVAVQIASPPAESHSRWQYLATEVLDDVDVATGRPHELLPVRDVGLAAVIELADVPGAVPARVRVEVGPTAVSWRVRAGGRYGCVAGRLDGHLTATCWPLSPADHTSAGRSCLPPGTPTTWQVARTWPQAAVARNDGGPRLLIRLDGTADARLVKVSVWRDVHYRPAVDGATSWRPGRGEFVLLGDFPVASRDSRHWGPISRGEMRHRVFAPTTPAATAPGW